MTTQTGADNITQALAQAPFKMSRLRWARLLGELRRRGADHRESGAFLLADRDGDRVTRVAYYDDLDANCLTGGISFATSGYTELWRICRTQNLKVVADVHTHPSRWVMQSEIDAANAMIARIGHVAMIVPSYGHADRIEECGVHIYLGSRRWIRVPADRSDTVVRLYGLLSREQIAEWAAALVRGIRRDRGSRP